MFAYLAIGVMVLNSVLGVVFLILHGIDCALEDRALVRRLEREARIWRIWE